MFKTGLVLASLTLAGAAYADQCSYIPEEVAPWAEKAVKIGDRVMYLCEPCGETLREARVEVVSNKGIGRVGDDRNYYQMYLNGKPVDLAYVFVQTGFMTFTNVGKLTGCKADRVSTQILLP